jgi:CBS domain-containing protein
MTKEVICAQPSDSVETCIHVMSQSGIRHLPVIEGDDVTGIVSLGDLVRWIMSAQSVRIHQLEHYIAGTYPA